MIIGKITMQISKTNPGVNPQDLYLNLSMVDSIFADLLRIRDPRKYIQELPVELEKIVHFYIENLICARY